MRGKTEKIIALRTSDKGLRPVIHKGFLQNHKEKIIFLFNGQKTALYKRGTPEGRGAGAGCLTPRRVPWSRLCCPDLQVAALVAPSGSLPSDFLGGRVDTQPCRLESLKSNHLRIQHVVPTHCSAVTLGGRQGRCRGPPPSPTPSPPVGLGRVCLLSGFLRDPPG